MDIIRKNQMNSEKMDPKKLISPKMDSIRSTRMD
jgi:hypothetical protein